MLGALAVAAVLAASPPRYTTRECSREEGGRSSRGIPCGGREAETYLEFLPSSGAGMPVAENLCDALAAEVPGWSTPVDGGAGNWCLGGDGQEVAGSQVDFEPFGSPEAVSVTVCPSGPDCTEKSALGLAASGSAAAAALDTGTGPITACWLGSVDNAGTGALLTAATGGATAQISWYIEHGVGSVITYVSDGSILRNPTMTLPDKDTINLICLSHGGAASAVRPYINGTAGTPSATVDRQSISVKPALSGINGTTTYAPVSAVAFGAFYVDQELSAAQIAAIARRVLADTPKALVRGSPSLALTYTRTGSMFCSKADNTGSILPANRPCISQNGILVEAAATNASLRSQELDNASWGTAGYGGASVPTVTANYGLAPDGTKTAERVQFQAATTPTQESLIYQLSTLAACSTGACTESLYVKSLSGAATIDMCLCGGSCLCSACSVNDSTWTRCTNTQSTIGAYQFIGNSGVYSGQNRAATDLLLWGAQVEAGSVATSYTPTTSASAARGLVTASISGLSLSPAPDVSGCMAATYDRPTLYDTSPLNLTSLVNGIGLLLYQQNATTFGVYRSAIIGTQTVTLAATGNRGVVSWVAGDYTAKFNGTPSTGSGAAPASNFNTLQIGDYNGSHPLGARVGSIQLDSRPSRCR